jgi:hypothetical protein
MVKAEAVRLLLIDRSLSGTRTSLMYDTSKRQRWKSECAICDFELDGLPFDMNEIELARHTSSTRVLEHLHLVEIIFGTQSSICCRKKRSQ